MGSVHSLRLRPLIRIERWTVGFLVSVRPCPPEIQSLRSFETEAEAIEHAQDLQRQHGFRIRPHKYAIADPGEAA